MSYLMKSLGSAASGLALLLLVGQLAACVVLLPGSRDDDGVGDRGFPEFLAVDVGCDAEDWWILTASVDHPAGVTSVIDVWAEVWLVYYDQYEYQSFDDFQSSIQLYLVEGMDWEVELSPADTFLDCYYSGEYLFRFFAEDPDGDRTSFDRISPLP